MKEKIIMCSFFNNCKNYNIKCDKCKWNASLDIRDYLLLETDDGKTIRYL